MSLPDPFPDAHLTHTEASFATHWRDGTEPYSESTHFMVTLPGDDRMREAVVSCRRGVPVRATIRGERLDDPHLRARLIATAAHLIGHVVSSRT